MLRTMLKSKIHRAVVTDANLNYEGSITIDKSLCEKADILEYEKVDIYNINNGVRFSTYVIFGKEGEIILNGAAARLVQKGDLVIIACYGNYSEEELKNYSPKILYVDNNNFNIDKKK
ncbi:MAG: aspartate 1-decarboxylase [Stygiobacter sp.]